MAIVSLDCPHCGAKLPPREDTGRTRCEYCGATFETAKQIARPAHAAANVHASKIVGLSIAFTVVLTAVIGGVVAFSAANTARITQEALDRIPEIPKIPGRAGDPLVPAARNEADFMWDNVGGPPVIAVIDGREHIVGRLRVRPDDQLHVAVFDADTGEARYRIGPLGSYSDGYRATHFAVADGRLAVTDFRSKLHVHDLATGAKQREIALTDRADQLCMVGETGEPPRVYLAQVDRREFVVDLAAGALQDGKVPKLCESLGRSERDGDPLARRADRLRRAPKVDGFDVEAVHIDGDLAVARGIKSPGTAYPMAVGFDPATREVRWKTPTASVDLATVRDRDNNHDALAAGRYVATYGEGQEYWHLTAFDAKTGARLWDHRLRSIFAVDWLYGLKVTDKNVFLVRMSSVEVHDAATGALKVTIGDESYDG